MISTDTNLLTIKLFGPFEARLNNKPLHELRLRSGESLLAFLALNHDRALRSTWLAETFWPDTAVVDGEMERALASLRQSVHHLRRSLSEEGGRIDSNNKAVSFQADGAFVDALAFDGAIAAGDSKSLEYAVTLYKGPLLEGWDEKWVLKERERYRDLYVDALLRLSVTATEACDYTAAARCLRRLLIASPILETAWRQLMEVLVSGGERLEATTIYRRYRDYLYKRGKLEPPASMTALYNQIQDRPAYVVAELQPEFTGYEPVGGAVPLKSAFYIQRPADAELNAAIARGDSIVLVKGPRQIGKTSLLVRGLDQARQVGSRLILTDLQKLAAADFDTVNTFFQALAQLISDQLELDASPRENWNSDRAPSSNFERFLRREVLNKIDAHVVWGLDEVDRLFPFVYRNDVFGMFRAWFNERAIQPDGPLSRMTLVMAYATEARLFITDLNQSPFNVGTRLTLDELTIEQAADLNQRYLSPLTDDHQIVRLFDLVGGHPYLIRRALREMKANNLDIDAIEQQANRDDGIFGDHLERMNVALRQDANLTEVVRGLLRGEQCQSPESFYRLRSAGVVSGEAPADMRLRCRLYTLYLTRCLL